MDISFKLQVGLDDFEPVEVVLEVFCRDSAEAGPDPSLEPGMHGIHVLYMIDAQLDPLPDVSAQHHVPYLYAGRVSLVTCMPVRA